MSVRRSFAAALVSACLAVATLLVPAAPGMAASSYHPRTGPTFNDPLGPSTAKYRVLNAVQDAIDHAPSGSFIRIMSWNIMSRSVVYKLLQAQRRGVRIHVLMDDSNRTELPNPDFDRLHRGFLRQNRSVKDKHRRSYARTCVGSCRGTRGQAHSKYFLFSRTGQRSHVLMEGSTNLTAAAALNQWNDVYTFVGNDTLYKFAGSIYSQMWRDKPVANPYVEQSTRSVQYFYSPMKGKNYHGDRRIQLLQKVHCWGAVNAGDHGRTVIRVAPDVIRNRRGMQLAQLLRYLWNKGCSVKIGYTVMGQDIHRFLRANVGRGPIPMKHLVQDYNGDGEFDNYFHLKAMSINGNVGTNPGAHYALNGSSNFSGFAASSDENIAIIHRKGATLSYQKYIDYWFENFPKNAPPTTTARRGPGFDPYAHVDMD